MQRWPHLSCRHEVYLLNDERYAIATRQMADWWAAEKAIDADAVRGLGNGAEGAVAQLHSTPGG